MNVIRYLIDFFHINGAGVQSVKYAKGQTYPADDETLSHVEAGHAEIVVIDVTATTSDAATAEPPQPDPTPVSDATTDTASVAQAADVAPATTAGGAP
ncbi:hypothetical protein, partial [Ralstonia solanacearum]|uniref:hypothetical protein n=1 Tax=Ralstonia solanacearum TaxID=305 RepID=UPI0005ACE731